MEAKRTEHPETGDVPWRSWAQSPMRCRKRRVVDAAVKSDQIGTPVNASDGSMPCCSSRCDDRPDTAFDRHVEKDLIPQFTPNNGSEEQF
jgi:hypothetical protein